MMRTMLVVEENSTADHGLRQRKHKTLGQYLEAHDEGPRDRTRRVSSRTDEEATEGRSNNSQKTPPSIPGEIFVNEESMSRAKKTTWPAHSLLSKKTNATHRQKGDDWKGNDATKTKSLCRLLRKLTTKLLKGLFKRFGKKENSAFYNVMPSDVSSTNPVEGEIPPIPNEIRVSRNYEDFSSRKTIAPSLPSNQATIDTHSIAGDFEIFEIKPRRKSSPGGLDAYLSRGRVSERRHFTRHCKDGDIGVHSRRKDAWHACGTTISESHQLSETSTNVSWGRSNAGRSVPTIPKKGNDENSSAATPLTLPVLRRFSLNEVDNRSVPTNGGDLSCVFFPVDDGYHVVDMREKRPKKRNGYGIKKVFSQNNEHKKDPMSSRCDNKIQSRGISLHSDGSGNIALGRRASDTVSLLTGLDSITDVDAGCIDSKCMLTRSERQLDARKCKSPIPRKGMSPIPGQGSTSKLQVSRSQYRLLRCECDCP